MDPTHLMAVRGREPDTEAEPVLVDHEPNNVAVLRLDDGDELRLDRTELRAALNDDHKQAA